MPRTDTLSHGDELLTGLLARQIVLLNHVRLLLALLAAMSVAGVVVGVIALKN